MHECDPLYLHQLCQETIFGMKIQAFHRHGRGQHPGNPYWRRPKKRPRAIKLQSILIFVPMEATQPAVDIDANDHDMILKLKRK